MGQSPVPVPIDTLEQANQLWNRMMSPTNAMPLGHDGYLKVWSLARPRIAADFILLDEAQDTSAVVLNVFRSQDAQVVYVGDRHQQIYEWRGAINAMAEISGCEEASLTQLVLFGTKIAAAASSVLATLGETKPLRGTPAAQSTIVPTGVGNAVRQSGRSGCCDGAAGCRWWLHR